MRFLLKMLHFVELNINMKSKNWIIKQIEDLKSELKRIIDTIEDTKGKETILVRTHKGYSLLYLKDASGNITYLSKSKTERIKKLSQSRYNSDFVRAAKREIAQLDKCLKALGDEKHGTADVDEVFNHFPEVLKQYITPHPLSSEEYARKWQEGNIVVKRKNIHKEDDYHKFKTIRGDYVASKSEVMIADRLLANGIPYHYEVAFIPETKVDKNKPVYDEFGMIIGYEAPGFDPTSRDTLHPDFYVLNKRTRKAYFWEHLGKLQDEKYCHTNLNRLIRMLDAGYKIGEDVLITHEDGANPLRTESIDDIIEKYLK